MDTLGGVMYIFRGGVAFKVLDKSLRRVRMWGGEVCGCRLIQKFMI